MTQESIGISGISLFLPAYRVDLQQWCNWTGADWGKIGSHIGHSFRMSAPQEDIYTMAAEAVLKVILAYGVNPGHVGFLALATESSSDNAVGAVIVRGLIDAALAIRGLPPLSRYCEVPEYKHACLAGLYALKGATRYLAHDAAPGRQAIVVAADIAEYERGSGGEPTQGAGAVAMLLERDPQLLALDLKTSGSSSSYRIADFRKPFLRYSGQVPGANGRLLDYPLFNGKYSRACYLDEVVCAFDALFGRRTGERARFLRSLAAAFMHRPYHDMPAAAWAMVYLFALGADGGVEHEELAGYCEAAGVTLSDVLAEMAERPSLADEVLAGKLPDEPYPFTARVVRSCRKSPYYREVVEDKLRLGAATMKHMGNLYTAALPAWIAAGLEEAQSQPTDLTGRKILLSGYGSGDAAEAIVATVSPNWRTAAALIGAEAALSDAKDVGPGDYARLHGGQWPDDLEIAERAGFMITHVGESSEAAFTDLGLHYYAYKP